MAAAEGSLAGTNLDADAVHDGLLDCVVCVEAE
jgi:hypothetical protein